MNAHVRDVVRPDGRLLVRAADEWTAEAAAVAAALASRRGRTALAHVDASAVAEQQALAAAGFAVSRRHADVVLPVEQALEALRAAAPPAGFELRSADDVDEDRLRLLDDELRQDVPGTSGWRSTPEEFHENTFADPDFDARTYLVAVDGESGEYLGLVRIWMTPGRPRLGMIGVRRGYRRRGIASALLARALQAVRASGGTEVETGYDFENRASRALLEPLGARLLGAQLELVYEPQQELSRVG